MTFAEILAEKGAEAGLSFTPLQLGSSAVITSCWWKPIR